MDFKKLRKANSLAEEIRELEKFERMIEASKITGTKSSVTIEVMYKDTKEVASIELDDTISCIVFREILNKLELLSNEFREL